MQVEINLNVPERLEFSSPNGGSIKFFKSKEGYCIVCNALALRDLQEIIYAGQSYLAEQRDTFESLGFECHRENSYVRFALYVYYALGIVQRKGTKKHG